MRPSLLLRAIACLSLVALLTACGSTALPPTQTAGQSPVVNHYDNPQNPHQ